MGQEIGLNELLKAGSHVAQAAQNIAPANPAMQVLGEIRALIQEIKGAVLSGIELVNAKKTLQSQNKQVIEVQTPNRIPAAKPPVLKEMVVVELLLHVAKNMFEKDPNYREKKVGELFDDIKEKPNLTGTLIKDFYNQHYDKFLDLGAS